MTYSCDCGRIYCSVITLNEDCLCPENKMEKLAFVLFALSMLSREVSTKIETTEKEGLKNAISFLLTNIYFLVEITNWIFTSHKMLFHFQIYFVCILFHFLDFKFKKKILQQISEIISEGNYEFSQNHTTPQNKEKHELYLIIPKRELRK